MLWGFGLAIAATAATAMSPDRRKHFTHRARDMFEHGYRGYMDHAFPLDELNPIKCTGRGPDLADPGNWGINDVLGNFSTTLVDSLDAVFTVLPRTEFDHAVRLVVDNVSFDQDSRVQVFEVTIRILGGLLSGHLIASGEVDGVITSGYKGELLSMAKDLGLRLLPAFDTGTGLPFPRVNLRSGVLDYEVHDTCTAGAGTLLLEFGVLSRLLKDSDAEIFEKVSRNALEFLWSRRSALDLLGNTIDIDSGIWIQKLSGVGAGADSFYEYLLKAHILFGDSEYYTMFDKAYNAILRHNRVSEGFLYRNVDMDSGQQVTNWVDSLSAFFPGLQVLAGDLNNAIKSHFTYFSIWQKYRALPERFDFIQKNINIAHYPLRPELIESTYFLYQATKNPYYLEVGAVILDDLDRLTRTSCGFGSMQSVASGVIEERMESFFLSETLKYLYLLFDEDNVLNRLHSNFVFTTEGHVLPLPRNTTRIHTGALPLPNYTCPKFQLPDLVWSHHSMESATASWLPISLPDLVHINRLIGNADFVSLDLVSKQDAAPTCIAYHGRRSSSSSPSNSGGNRGISFEQVVQESDVMVAAAPGSPDSLLVPQVTYVADGYRLSTLNNVLLTLRLDGFASSYIISKFQCNGESYVVAGGLGNVRVEQQGMQFLLSEPIKTDAVEKREDELTFKVKSHDDGSWTEYPVFLAAFSTPFKEKASLDLELMPKYAPSTSGTQPDLLNGCTALPKDAESSDGAKIMMVIKRGGCSFEEKAETAFASGASGLIVVNSDDYIIGMLGNEDGRRYDIPIVMMQQSAWKRVEKEYESHSSRGVARLNVELTGAGTEERISGMQLQYAHKFVSNLMIVEYAVKPSTGQES
ncbi:glycoside hydrolase [Chytriomyces cf. hyalinus JEL632]|nr:glycoside hydrolase [Chytriomyces cf. hyalinus JEL632]